MAWIQRVALLLQRCSTVPSLTRAGLGSNLSAPAAGRLSYLDNPFAASARGAVYCRTFGVAAKFDDEDATPIPDFTGSGLDATRNAEAAAPNAEAFEATRAEVEKTLSAKELPRKRVVMDLIQSAASKEHIDVMFELLKKMKIERAVLRQQMSPLNPNISVQVALACERAGELERGLASLQHRNPYGLRPCLDAAHVLIDKAGERNDADLAVKAFRTLLQSGLNPKSTTADLLLRAIMRSRGYSPDFFRLAEEFFLNGIKVWGGWYEKLITRAMNTGRYELFEKWARRREEGGIPVARRTGFLVARGYVLMGDAKRAADVLAKGRTESQNSEAEGGDAEWDAQCRAMVAEWPTWLQEKRGPKFDSNKLRATLVELQTLLKEQGVRFEVDVAKDFIVRRR